MENYYYCNFGDYTSIKSILETAFKIDDFNAIRKAYKTFIENFYKNNCKERETIERENFMPITGDEFFLDKYQNADYTIGVDLPVMITNKEINNGKCVFIVGEDALRKSCNSPDIILSTPFGTHYTEFRDTKGKGKLYWDFSIWLLAQGYSVYYTDMKKIWMKKKESKGKKLIMPADLLKSFSICLEKEIEVFDPKFIITFGKDAEISMIQMSLGKPLLPFIHPTGTARGHWKIKHDIKPPFDENVLNFMRTEFEKKEKTIQSFE